MLEIEDVYTPSEIEALHQTYGWMSYIGSSAHARRMLEANAAASDAAFAAYRSALSQQSARPQALHS